MATAPDDTTTPPSAPSARTTVGAPLDEVWAVVSDPRTYPQWLVGARQIRAVDDRWPEPGTSFHHTIGWAPLRLRDRTDVVSVDAPHELVLRPHLSVLGTATVTIGLQPDGEGGTVVEISEAPHAGVIGRLWHVGARNLVRVGLWGRNTKSLQQLEVGVEDGTIVGRPAGHTPSNASPDGATLSE